MGWLSERIRSVGTKRWFAKVMRPVAPPVDRAFHRLTGGRLRLSEALLPTLMLTTIGNKTGKQRQTPLAYVDYGDAWVVAATNWGQDHDPAWAKNLLAEPHAAVAFSGEPIPVRGRRVEASELDDIWPRFVKMWPAYAAYEDRIDGARDIPVFVLEPRNR